ncbi:hypothetical protein TNCV_1199541 [Trichonephila clavipes]|uniref:Uncharacterized protein n=1 Tax=Trichonephila clavipes TaxID=2585209 RepID=A0A8X6S913_TRICX|nr:hypothetical protein TNCV_1199541 [Trichonephila clavipes]
MDSRRNPWRRGNIGVDIVFFEIGIEREEKKWTPEEIHGGESRHRIFEIGIEREEKKWTPEEIRGGEVI